MKNPKKQLECELRGPITWSDFLDLKKKIEEDFGTFKVTKELAIFIQGAHDIRIKINTDGGSFVYKRKVGINDYKKEIEVSITKKDILKLIETVSYIGFNGALYSYVEKYEAKQDNKSFSVKFGSKIGDFFEIETLLSNESDIAKATRDMEKYIVQLGLQLWNNEVYDDLVKSSWKDVKTGPLFDQESKCFNKAIVSAIEKIYQSSDDNHQNLREILETTSNDYTREEEIFLSKYKHPLLSERPLGKIRISTTSSIIIPTFNSKETLIATLLSLNNQSLTKKELSLLEVVIVDDGSTDNTNLEVNKWKFNFEIKYIKQNHIGRGNARNIGVAVSKGDIIIFLDSDIIVDENFVKEHVLRHEAIEKGVFVSFKENISLNKSRINLFLEKSMKPDIRNDFRFHKKVDKKWLRVHRHVRSIECRDVKILEETNNFKTFGENKVCGVWDLSSMVVTCAISIKRTEFINCGGFNLQFKGWGMEDTFLGTCLIARGNFIIPVFSTGVFHIEHKPRSGGERKRIKEFNKNVLVYLDLVSQRVDKVIKNLYAE
jgi:glycosyltransferase involved in cell wall biosynthesis/adenylate cyclase class IV